MRKLMRILGFQSKARPKRRYNSYQGEQSKIAENLLQRHFGVEAPDTVYVSDVTEFWVDQRKLYLSPIMDLFDHSILSYTIDRLVTYYGVHQSKLGTGFRFPGLQQEAVGPYGSRFPASASMVEDLVGGAWCGAVHVS